MAVLTILVISWSQLQAYSPDSWSFYELSQSISSDFYRINTVRNFQFLKPYGTSFPPLWPAIIWLTSSVFRTGPVTGLLFNLLVVLGLAVVTERFFRAHLSAEGAGPVLALAVLAFDPWREEVVGGRSIPLTTLCLAGLITVFTRGERLTLKDSASIGAMLGAMAMTRFDWALAAAGLVLLLFVFTMPRPYLGPLLLALGVLFLTVLPWIAYSWIRFGRLFVSDNGAIALSAVPHFVTDYFHGEPTLFSAPWTWFGRVVGNLEQVLYAAAGVVKRSLPPMLVGIPLGAVALLVSRASRRSRDEVESADALIAQAWFRRRMLIVAGAIGFVAFFPAIVFAYPDERYFANLWFLSAAALVGLAIVLVRRVHSAGLVVLKAAAPAAFAVMVIALSSEAHSQALGSGSDLPMSVERRLLACSADSQGLMVIGNDNTAAQIGALGGQRTLLQPRNLTDLTVRDVRALIDKFQVDRLFRGPAGGQPAHEAEVQRVLDHLATSGLRVSPDPCLEGLYRVAIASAEGTL